MREPCLNCTRYHAASESLSETSKTFCSSVEKVWKEVQAEVLCSHSAVAVQGVVLDPEHEKEQPGLQGFQQRVEVLRAASLGAGSFQP